MEKITRDDLLDLTAYEKVRPDRREEIMALRALRRVHAGDLVALNFETRETLWYQIQEMIRAERMVDDEPIQFELDTYNELVPGGAELVITLFIEIPDKKKLYEWLPRLPGIEDSVVVEIEGAGVARGEGEAGRSKEDVTATVHYVHVPLSDDQAAAVKGGARCQVRIDHPEYQAGAELPAELVKSLAGDLD